MGLNYSQTELVKHLVELMRFAEPLAHVDFNEALRLAMEEFRNSK